MNSADYRLYQALMAIAHTAYPNEKIAPFTVGIKKHDALSFHGQWYPPTKTEKAHIAYTNITRPLRYQIKVLIHELSHHMEYHFHKCIGHSRTFYDIYEKLFVTACRMNIITQAMLAEGFEGDARDWRKIMKRVEKHDLNVVPSLEYKKNVSIVKAVNAYRFKNVLKQRCYSYNDYTSDWEKEINNNDMDDELEFLSDNDISYRIGPLLNIENRVVIKVSGKTYPIRMELKDHDYRYLEGNTWIKKVPAEFLEPEIPYIDSLKEKRFKVTIAYEGGSTRGK